MSCQFALRFLILTIGARSKPVRLLTLDQIDDDVWIAPAEMMKGRKGKAQVFRIPLSSEAFSVVESAKTLLHGDLLFPGSKPGQPISDMTMNKYMKDKGREARPHGFRSSFREWADHHGYRPEVAEAALAHSIGSEVARAYLKTDYLEERRLMMERWGEFAGAKA